MPLPHFIVIGAAKAATSSLCASLEHHPQIHIPAQKEFNFFSMDEVYSRGVEWYAQQFQPEPGSMVGEGSVSYTFQDAHPKTVGRIHKHNPLTRLIYIVRDPIARLISLYRQFQAAGTLGPVSLQQALETHPSLLDSARYWKQISAYRDHFPDSQILVLFFDDWRNDPQSSLRQCCEFLGVGENVELPVTRKGQTMGQLRDRQFLWKLRNMNGFGRVRDLLPDRVRQSIRPLLKKPIRRAPVLSADTKRLLVDDLSEDLAKFLAFYGRPDLWDLNADRRDSAAA